MTEKQLPKNPKNIKKFLEKQGGKIECLDLEDNSVCNFSLLDSEGMGFSCKGKGINKAHALKRCMRLGIKYFKRYLKQCEFIDKNY